MLEKIKKSGYETVLNNFLNLALVQGVGLLLPLMTIPYIIRVVGIENVGLVAFVTSVVNYFGIIINFGFNLSGTMELAQNIKDKIVVNEIFCNVTYSKFFLSIFCLLVFVIMVAFIPSFQKNFLLYFYLLLSVIFTSLTPDWFFQGIQKMKFITRLNVVLKILSTILIFVFVKKTSDYIFLGFIPFINCLLLFIITQHYVHKEFTIRFLPVSFKKIFNELDKGKYVFLSQVKITFFSNFNILLLGILTNNTAVGIFSSADKIIKVFSAIQVPVVLALFPHFAIKIKENKVSAWFEINKIAKKGGVIYLFVMFIVFLLANFTAKIMFGTEVKNIALLIRIMSIIPVFVFLNNLFGTQYLLNTKNDKAFLLVLIMAAIINVLLLFPFIHILGALGVSISVLITEFFVFAGMYFAARRVFNKSNNNI